jgi:tetratricopeptide (TPR) repeat protein
MLKKWSPAIVIGLSLVIYLATLPPTILPGDSGELIAASRTLSIAHPPGYPLYVLLGRIFSTAATGSIAYRYNLLSALISTAAAAMLCLLLLRLGIRAAVSIGMTIAVIAGGSFWLQATCAEVYPLNGLFTVLLFFAAILVPRLGERSFILLAYIAGLAISHHLTLVYSVVSAILLSFMLARNLPSRRTIFFGAFLFLMGLTVWLYIPIRAKLAPPMTWGETDKLGGFVSHVLADRYSWRLKSFDLLQRVQDFLRFFRVAAVSLGWPLTILAVIGCLTHLRKSRYVAAFVCLVVLFAFHYAIYNIPDIEGHLLPFLIGAAVLAALGAHSLIETLSRVWRFGRVLVIVAVFAIAVVNVVSITPRQDEWFAYDYAEAIEESAVEAVGRSPVIVTTGDLAMLSVLYLSLVEERDFTVFIKGVSHPSVLGMAEMPVSMDNVLRAAERRFGASRATVVGLAEVGAISADMSMCGMVWVPGSLEEPCRSPLDFEIRGVGADSRDFFSRALSAEYYLHAARWQLGVGDTVSAAQSLDKVIGSAMNDAQTYVEASRLYMEMGLAADAEQLLRRAVEAEPTHFFARFALANVLGTLGRLDEARYHYEKGLRGNPDPVPTLVNLGGISISMGNHSRAAEYFRRALDIDSTNATANVGMATALEAMSRPEEALASVERALRDTPGYSQAYFVKASLLMDLDRYPEAYVALKEGLAVSPEDARMLSALGLYYLRDGLPDSASKYFEEAIGSDPLLLSAHGNLAIAYERMGQRGRAAEQYRRYISLAPPGRSRQMAVRALEEIESTGTAVE